MLNTISLSAPGGGEGRGEVGEPGSDRARGPPPTPPPPPRPPPPPPPPPPGGVWGGEPGSDRARPTSPSHACSAGPSLSPLKGGEAARRRPGAA
jgi:hypothetical protein